MWVKDRAEAEKEQKPEQEQLISFQEYKYHEIHSPMLEDPDFDGKPLVMLIGQYSTGKTTFIRQVKPINKI